MQELRIDFDRLQCASAVKALTQDEKRAFARQFVEGSDLSRWPNIAAWLERVRAQPGFTPMAA